MPTFSSEVRALGQIYFPKFTGIRVIMMPFLVHDPVDSVPRKLRPYTEALQSLLQSKVDHASRQGVGYLTIDEAVLKAGEYHRRPGLHVDGGSWSGPKPWAKNGMLLASTIIGCRAWNQNFEGEEGLDGDVEHLRDQCRPSACVVMQPRMVYSCSPMTVHETLPQAAKGQRQFIRLSFPSDGAWYEGYTPNPLGIKPNGPTLPRRTEQLAYRL